MSQTKSQANSQASRLFLEAPPFGLIVRMAAPNTVAFFLQSAVSLAEVWFISRLGTSALAAIALSFPLLMLNLTMAGGALGGAVTSSIARAFGDGDTARAEQLIWHALSMAAAGAGVLWLFFTGFGRDFLMLLGGSDEVLAQAMSYSRFCFLVPLAFG